MPSWSSGIRVRREGAFLALAQTRLSRTCQRPPNLRSVKSPFHPTTLHNASPKHTEVGIELKFKHAAYPVLIGVTHVAEMNELTPGEKGVTVGASVTLTRLMESFAALRASVAPHQRPVLAAVVEQLRYFAGPPIRNTAGLGGNVATASPISDLNPLWMAAGATFFLRGRGTPERAVPARDFFLGYRTVDMQPHEVLVKVRG